MKLKKWLAVALAAVMTAGMLAGCGGGGTGGSLSINQVNRLLADAGSSVTAQSSELLDNAVKTAVDAMETDGTFSTAKAMESIDDTLGVFSIDLMTGIKAAGAYVITEEELERGINAAALAQIFNVNIDTGKMGDLAVVESANEFAAAAVLAADTLVHQESTIRQYVQDEALAEQLAALIEAGVDFEYAVSAQRTSHDGVTYWVFGAQATAYLAGSEQTEQN